MLPPSAPAFEASGEVFTSTTFSKSGLIPSSLLLCWNIFLPCFAPSKDIFKFELSIPLKYILCTFIAPPPTSIEELFLNTSVTEFAWLCSTFSKSILIEFVLNSLFSSIFISSSIEVSAKSIDCDITNDKWITFLLIFIIILI